MMIAEKLSYRYLDSGSLYRSLALKLYEKNNNLENILEKLDEWINDISIDFRYKKGEKAQVFVNGEDFTNKIRTEKVAIMASSIATDKRARDMLEKYQRSYLTNEGLVADGRDMGTKVFPEAQLKIFLTASIEERASRRYKQLLEKGENVKLRALEEQVRSRDERDMNRETSPLAAATDAVEVDSSDLTIQEAVDSVQNLAILRGLL